MVPNKTTFGLSPSSPVVLLTAYVAIETSSRWKFLLLELKLTQNSTYE